MTLGELVEVLGGVLVQGSPEIMLAGVATSAAANGLDLVFAEDAASAGKALAGAAAAVVLKPGCAEALFPGHAAPRAMGIVETGTPRLWFARAAQLLKPEPSAAGVHPAAVIGTLVELGEDVTIGPCAVIGECAVIGAGSRVEAGAVIGPYVRIGEHCHIYPRAVLYRGTTLGNNVIVHAGAVLGADGFGYVRDPASGAYTQFPQQGTLAIEDDVEIGANSTIDRGALRQTKIGRGTKIDNLVHIGHNCEIGEDVHLRVQHRGQGRGHRRPGGHRRPCAHRSGRDSGRPGRGVQRQDGEQRRSEAGNGAVGDAGPSAQAGSARNRDCGPPGKKAGNREQGIGSGAVD